MVDTSGIRTDFTEVAMEDWLAGNSTAAAGKINGSYVNLLGQKLIDVIGELSNVGIRVGDEVELDDSSQAFLRVDIPDDSSDTNTWPDRFAFYFEDGTPGGRRTGYFNEYGELRARPAKNNTVGFRSMPLWSAPASQEFAQFSDDSLDTILGISKDHINLYRPLRHAPSDTPLANVIVLDDGEPVPVGTPEGTVVIVRPL